MERYTEGKSVHFLHSITRSTDLKFQDLVEVITDMPCSIDIWSVAGIQASTINAFIETVYTATTFIVIGIAVDSFLPHLYA